MCVWSVRSGVTSKQSNHYSGQMQNVYEEKILHSIIIGESLKYQEGRWTAEVFIAKPHG